VLLAALGPDTLKNRTLGFDTMLSTVMRVKLDDDVIAPTIAERYD